MYLAILKKIPLRDELIDTFKVFGCVDPERLVLRFDDANAVAVFECAELFERLSAFEGANRHCGIAEQEILAVYVKPDVFKVSFVDAAIVGYGAA
jgi:hypothetical protein